MNSETEKGLAEIARARTLRGLFLLDFKESDLGWLPMYCDLRASGDSHSTAVDTIKGEKLMAFACHAAGTMNRESAWKSRQKR